MRKAAELVITNRALVFTGYGFVDFSLKIQKAEGIVAPQ
jgi:hypothetical protein